MLLCRLCYLIYVTWSVHGGAVTEGGRRERTRTIGEGN